MKSARRNSLPFFALLAMVVAMTCPLSAQTNEPPARLGIIAEPEVAVVADLLTVELSAKPNLQVLEREQIGKVYREQGLSAANRDYVKLGQLLGADGLLIAEMVKEGAENYLGLRLIAVKPGVVLDAIRSPWPVTDLAEWLKGIPKHFMPLFPKLHVLVKDAVPISVVNLRSAVSSRETRELEQQLTQLTIERLTRERELFVLERRRMESLSAEKELKGVQESAFWNGGYLLEGVIDRDGYSKERVTVHARLVPPAGGAPLELVAEGPRTNVVGVVETLAVRILKTLKRGSFTTGWQPEAEAQKYFEEAQWALKWRMMIEAQSASESAWALGKRDLDCASARVRAYAVAPDYNKEYDGSRVITVINPSPEMATRKPPSPEELDQSLRALEIYLNFSRTLTLADWSATNVAWYSLGVHSLTVASQVLQHFHLVPAAQSPLIQEMAELRAVSRDVADWISGLPWVRSTYFTGDRIVGPDELIRSFQANSNIFSCKLKWGCFWQEHPQDTLPLYRELMASPLFVQIHSDFWFRPPNTPRLVAWSLEAEKRLPEFWNGFVAELNSSTNAFCRMEAKALEFADLRSDSELKVDPQRWRQLGQQAVELARAERDARLAFAGEALFNCVLTNHEEIVTGRDQLTLSDWGLSAFFFGGGAVSETTEKLDRRFREQIAPQLAALNENFRIRNRDRLKENEHRVELERQKRYLMDFTAYEFQDFIACFRFRDYTKSQAAELKPLLAAYKSNLLAQAQGKPPADQFKAGGDVQFIDVHVGRLLDASLSASPPPTAPLTASLLTNVPRPMPPRPGFMTPNRNPPPLAAGDTNALAVKKYWRIPLEQIPTKGLIEFGPSVQRWSEGRLLIGLNYRGGQGFNFAMQSALGIFDPEQESWEIIQFPNESRYAAPMGMMAGGEIGAYFELYRGDYYLSDDALIKKYDAGTGRWQSLPLPQHKDARLFAVQGRLFAANEENIFEIHGAGRNTTVLASTRRRPAASKLDALEKLGSVVLFPGPNESLRAAVQNKVYVWETNDWQEASALAHTGPPLVFPDATILRRGDYRQSPEIWLLSHHQAEAELCWREPNASDPRFGNHGGMPSQRPQPVSSIRPTWEGSYGHALTAAAVATVESNLWFFVPFADLGDASASQAALAAHGRHADLVCLRRGTAVPLIIPLTFSATEATPTNPVRPNRSAPIRADLSRILFTANFLLIRQNSAAGIWAIPQADLEYAIAQARTRHLAKAAVRPAATAPGIQPRVSP